MKVLLLLIFISSSMLASARTFTAEDIYKIRYSTEPKISKGGRYILYNEYSTTLKTDLFKPTIKIYDRINKKNLPIDKLINKNPLEVKWARIKNTLIYVLAKKNDKSSLEVHLLNLSLGSDTLLKTISIDQNQTAADFKISPDNNWISFVRSNKVSRVSNTEIELPEGSTPAPKPVMVESGNYDGSRDQIFKELMIVSLKDQSDTIIRVNKLGTSISYSETTSYLWGPKSDKLIFHIDFGDQSYGIASKNDLYSYELKSKKRFKITDSNAFYTVSAFDPSGRYLVYHQGAIEFDGKHSIVIYDMDTKTRNIQLVSSKKYHIHFWNVETYWLEEKKSVVFSYLRNSQLYLGLLDLKGNVKELGITIGSKNITSPYFNFYSDFFSVSSDGILAYQDARPDRTPEIALYDLTDSESKNNISNSWDDFPKDVEFGEVHEVWHQSSYDQKKIQGWLITPPNFYKNKKYPLITFLHGGPYLMFSPTFSYRLQLLAAKGYLVYYPNFRGSLSYGTDFITDSYLNYPGPAMELDITSGVQTLLQSNRFNIDDKNLFVMGASAGGVLSSWIVTQTHMFNAASVISPIVNNYQDIFGNGYINAFAKYLYRGIYPWDDITPYLINSPILEVEKVKTPTMLMVGEEDKNTPKEQAIQFYNALQILGVDSSLVLFPEVGHSYGNRVSNNIRMMEYSMLWFDKYLVKDLD